MKRVVKAGQVVVGRSDGLVTVTVAIPVMVTGWLSILVTILMAGAHVPQWRISRLGSRTLMTGRNVVLERRHGPVVGNSLQVHS